MRNIIFCLLIYLFVSVAPVYAGPGHSHGPATPISENDAVQTATKIVSLIVQKGKIDKSWAAVKSAQVEKKKNQYGHEWVVTFNNPKEADLSRQVLYVFLSLDGQYLGANFSGS